MSLVLEAADRWIEAPARFRSEFVLSAGAEVCPAPSSCESATWMLHAQAFGVESDVPVGERRELGIANVRSVRDVDVYGACGACAMCGSAEGAWVAWVRH